MKVQAYLAGNGAILASVGNWPVLLALESGDTLGKRLHEAWVGPDFPPHSLVELEVDDEYFALIVAQTSLQRRVGAVGDERLGLDELNIREERAKFYVSQCVACDSILVREGNHWARQFVTVHGHNVTNIVAEGLNVRDANRAFIRARAVAEEIGKFSIVEHVTTYVCHCVGSSILPKHWHIVWLADEYGSIFQLEADVFEDGRVVLGPTPPHIPPG